MNMQAVSRPPILLVASPMLAPLVGGLSGPFEVVRLWEVGDPAAFAAGQGAQVRAILTVGEAWLDSELLEAMPNLGLVACVSAGYDKLDVEWCRRKGVAITHSPAVNAEDVADHAVASAVAGWRGIVEGDRRLRAGLWNDRDRVVPRRSLLGCQVGIVGLGHIGLGVGRRMEAFRTSVAWWGPNPKPDAPWPRVDSLLGLAEASDLLFITVRAGQTNVGLIDRAVIEAVGPRGLICNVSRGFVVDQDALIAALKDGRLGGAALDVFDPEPTSAELWREAPNTVLTPHIAGSTDNSITAMMKLTFENIRRFFAGEPLATPIPELA
jgi:lactate dehydrogenase-like 2-hydroxyacid dehydrogenase